jgi:lycopene beta-cyclase
MISSARFDLAILGAGSAGLSLAAALAQNVGEKPINVAVIEARDDQPPDRVFSFWANPRELRNPPWPLLGRWQSWRFSDRDGNEVLHDGGDERHYAAISALTHRHHCLERIGGQPRFQLIRGVVVTALEPHADAIEVRGEGFRAWAKHVVDTRNHADHSPFEARLYQQFVGHVWQRTERSDLARPVDLMTDMSADADGFRFVYRLPLSRERLLVEETRFTPRILPWRRLEADCRRADGASFSNSATLLATERGVVPMGMVAIPPPDPRIRLAGARGGAVRAASGYAFRRIQDWASHNARQVERHGLAALAGHPPELCWRAAMDQLFLEVLRQHPDRAPALFMALARNASSRALADFLSDRGGLTTAVRIVKAMPGLLFLRAALTRRAPPANP